jgi:hypothetical protein
MSTSSTQQGRIEIGSYASKASLAPTCSTAADPDAHPNVRSSQELNEPDNSDVKIVRPESQDLPRTQSFSLGSNLVQAKKWGRNVLQEIKAPLRRHKIRQGKQPALEMGNVPHVGVTASQTPSEILNVEFTTPSSSRRFRNMKLQGGTGPPQYLSEQTLNKLDQLDREQARMRRELDRLEKGKEELLKRAQIEDKQIMNKEKQRLNGKDKKTKDAQASNIVKPVRSFARPFVM